MQHTRTIKIPQVEAKEMQEYLDSEGQDNIATIKSYTADFGDDGEGDIAVDIKVCVGNPPFVDPVIFQDNHDIGCMEVSDTLLGEYNFDHFLKDKYRVILETV